MTFGDYVRAKRIDLGLTLRGFSENKGYDVAYVSRIENGYIAPPEDQSKLKALAVALELKEESEEWVRFFDLAAAEKGVLPEDIKAKASNINFLPAFYRTLRKKEIDNTDIEKLVKILRDGKA